MAKSHIDWEALLLKEAEVMAHALTTKLLLFQQLYVPSQVYFTRSGDPAWFSYRCWVVAEAKHTAWLRCNHHPSFRNKA